MCKGLGKLYLRPLSSFISWNELGTNPKHFMLRRKGNPRETAWQLIFLTFHLILPAVDEALRNKQKEMGFILGIIIEFPIFSCNRSISFVLCITTLQQAICQPILTEEVAGRGAIVLTTKPTKFVHCLTLVSDDKAFFDEETQVIFKCSPLTCPGISGCTKCCSSPAKNAKATTSQPKKVQVEKEFGEYPTKRSASFSPATDPVFLVLAALIVLLSIIAFVTCLSGYYERNRQKQKCKKMALVYSATYGPQSNRLPNCWMKLSGRSCKVSPKCSKFIPDVRDTPTGGNPIQQNKDQVPV